MLCHFVAFYAVSVISREQRQHRRSDLHIVDPSVPLGQQRPCHGASAVIHRVDHVVVLARPQPRIHVLRQKFRLFFLHQVIIFHRYR